MSLEVLNLSAAILGAATSAAAVLIKTWVTIRLKAHDVVLAANEASSIPPQDALQPALDRLEEVRAALSRQQFLAATNRWVNRLLTVGQYIIGGLLASSFVQQSLSREMVGALGLLVLISSLIYQHFRPDLQLREAMGRSLRLRSLVRQADDDIYAMRSGSSNAPSVADFRRKISTALTDIEASEYQDLTARGGEDAVSNSK
jgi:hypothetical protein